MRASFTPHFQRSYQKLPESIQEAFDKQLVLLLKDLRHPSLRSKKYDEERDIWQARVTGSHRKYAQLPSKRDYSFMKYLIDTDKLIDFLHGKEDVVEAIKKLIPQGVAISVLTILLGYEIYQDNES